MHYVVITPKRAHCINDQMKCNNNNAHSIAIGHSICLNYDTAIKYTYQLISLLFHLQLRNITQ